MAPDRTSLRNDLSRNLSFDIHGPDGDGQPVDTDRVDASNKAAIEDFIAGHVELSEARLNDANGVTAADQVYAAEVEELQRLYRQAQDSEDSAFGSTISERELGELRDAAYAVDSASFRSEDRFDAENAPIDGFNDAPPALGEVRDERTGEGSGPEAFTRIGLGQTDAASGGTTIADIQRALFERGYYDDLGGTEAEIDGHFGPRTRQALLQFQSDNDEDLAVSGFVGQDDLIELGLLDRDAA